MKKEALSIYRCPIDGGPLQLEDESLEGSDVVTGTLTSRSGRSYPIKNGAPILLAEDAMAQITLDTRSEYDRVARDIYDRAVDWQFAAFLEDEEKVREEMVDLLRLDPGMRILEIGCGTGRDSFRIARRLSSAGELHMQDLSGEMVAVCIEQMKEHAQEHDLSCDLEYSVSDVAKLPYADESFDCVFHFGGFNHFADMKHCAAELARVTKKGGRILFGDEAVAPWLKGSEFDKIVSTNNPLFKADIPLSCLPEGAREVSAHWLIANCFYVITFTKDVGPPPLDLDLKHEGLRGGSMRTRYFGILEGVSLETKGMVKEAATRAGMSMHEWLDKTVREAAKQESEK